MPSSNVNTSGEATGDHAAISGPSQPAAEQGQPAALHIPAVSMSKAPASSVDQSAAGAALPHPVVGAATRTREDWAARLMQRRFRKRTSIQQVARLAGLSLHTPAQDKKSVRVQKRWTEMADLIAQTLRVDTESRTPAQMKLMHNFGTDMGLFGDLKAGFAQRECARRMKCVDLQPCQTLFAEGSLGDLLYFVLKGSLQLLVSGRVAQELSFGSILCSDALREARVRTASAVAKDTCTVLTLSRADYMLCLGTLWPYARELVQTKANQRENFDLNLLFKLLEGLIFFKHCQPLSVKRNICRHLQGKTVAAVQGEVQILEHGAHVQYVKAKPTLAENTTSFRSTIEITSFGECAMYGVKDDDRRYNSTIVAVNTCELLVLHRHDFATAQQTGQEVMTTILETPPAQRAEDDIVLLHTFLKNCRVGFIQNLKICCLQLFCCRYIGIQRAEARKEIYRQGQMGSNCYVIIAGEVAVLEIEGAISQGLNAEVSHGFKEVHRLRSGQSFGERSITAMKNGDQLRTSSVVTTQNCVFATLQRDDYRFIAELERLNPFFEDFWCVCSGQEYHHPCTFAAFRRLYLRLQKVFKKSELWNLAAAEVSCKSKWQELTGEYHVGYDLAMQDQKLLTYDLFSNTLLSFFFSFLSGIQSAIIFRKCIKIALNAIRTEKGSTDDPNYSAHNGKDNQEGLETTNQSSVRFVLKALPNTPSCYAQLQEVRVHWEKQRDKKAHDADIKRLEERPKWKEIGTGSAKQIPARVVPVVKSTPSSNQIKSMKNPPVLSAEDIDPTTGRPWTPLSRPQVDKYSTGAREWERWRQIHGLERQGDLALPSTQSQTLRYVFTDKHAHQKIKSLDKSLGEGTQSACNKLPSLDKWRVQVKRLSRRQRAALKYTTSTDPGTTSNTLMDVTAENISADISQLSESEKMTSKAHGESLMADSTQSDKTKQNSVPQRLPSVVVSPVLGDLQLSQRHTSSLLNISNLGMLTPAHNVNGQEEYQHAQPEVQRNESEKMTSKAHGESLMADSTQSDKTKQNSVPQRLPSVVVSPVLGDLQLSQRHTSSLLNISNLGMLTPAHNVNGQEEYQHAQPEVKTNDQQVQKSTRVAQSGQQTVSKKRQSLCKKDAAITICSHSNQQLPQSKAEYFGPVINNLLYGGLRSNSASFKKCFRQPKKLTTKSKYRGNGAHSKRVRSNLTQAHIRRHCGTWESFFADNSALTPGQQMQGCKLEDTVAVVKNGRVTASDLLASQARSQESLFSTRMERGSTDTTRSLPRQYAHHQVHRRNRRHVVTPANDIRWCGGLLLDEEYQNENSG